MLSKIFEFLNENREYNEKIQKGFFYETIEPFRGDTSATLKYFLWKTNATQSRASIKNVSEFWKKLGNKKLDSISKLLTALGEDAITEPFYKNLFLLLKKHPSWGPKTSALFVQKLYQLHCDPRFAKLSFNLPGVPKELKTNDQLYLPVDTVIIKIFNKLYQDNMNFVKINKILNDNYKGNQIEIWDDLWFWGFITQKGTGENRIFEWNEEKYWALLYAPKDQGEIRIIEKKANEFINMISY